MMGSAWTRKGRMLVMVNFAGRRRCSVSDGCSTARIECCARQ